MGLIKKARREDEQGILKRIPIRNRGKKQLKKWEYKIVAIAPRKEYTEFEDELNKIGQNGWELVTISQIFIGRKGVGVWVFKRSKED